MGKPAAKEVGRSARTVDVVVVVVEVFAVVVVVDGRFLSGDAGEGEPGKSEQQVKVGGRRVPPGKRVGRSRSR